jgi:hypothetical protein
MKQGKPTTCHCGAYKFPHRVGGGKCHRVMPQSKANIDSWTGRSSQWECTCFFKHNPYCPQHGNELYRRDDIPDSMKVG